MAEIVISLTLRTYIHIEFTYEAVNYVYCKLHINDQFMHLSGVFLSGHLRITPEEVAAAVPAIVVAVVTAGLVRKCCR